MVLMKLPPRLHRVDLGGYSSRPTPAEERQMLRLQQKLL